MCRWKFQSCKCTEIPLALVMIRVSCMKSLVGKVLNLVMWSNIVWLFYAWRIISLPSNLGIPLTFLLEHTLVFIMAVVLYFDKLEEWQCPLAGGCWRCNL